MADQRVAALAPLAPQRELPSFGLLLRRYRVAAGITQEELAEQARLSARAVSALERGVNRAPQRGTLEALTAALHLGPDEAAQLRAAARRRLSGREPAATGDSHPPHAPQRGGAMTTDVNDLTREAARTETASTEAAAPPPAGAPLLEQMAHVAAGIRQGDLSRRLRVPAAGEDAEAVRAVNRELTANQVFIGALVSELARVSRQVGTDGWLGCQAEVPGVTGIWQHLVESTNVMAERLTIQVRDCSQVAEAAVGGDYQRRVKAAAAGETRRLIDALHALIEQLG